MIREVVVTAYATADLLEIVDWIAANDSPAGARHVLERIESAVAGLARFPLRGAHPQSCSRRASVTTARRRSSPTASSIASKTSGWSFI